MRNPQDECSCCALAPTRHVRNEAGVCPVACIGAWLPCASACNQRITTFIVSTPATVGGRACEAAHGDTRPCPAAAELNPDLDLCRYCVEGVSRSGACDNGCASAGGRCNAERVCVRATCDYNLRCVCDIEPTKTSAAVGAMHAVVHLVAMNVAFAVPPYLPYIIGLV